MHIHSQVTFPFISCAMKPFDTRVVLMVGPPIHHEPVGIAVVYGNGQVVNVYE